MAVWDNNNNDNGGEQNPFDPGVNAIMMIWYVFIAPFSY
jgi:hypothetical protein